MWEFWKSKSVRIQDWKETLMRKGSYQGSDGSTTPMGSHEGDNASGGSAAGETPRNRIRLRNDKDTRVNFKDLQVAMDDLTEESDSVEEGGARNTDSTSAEELTKRRRRQLVQRHKLIIIMVGLPGRGKTFLCNKLKCYLNWLGHRTAHINVGQYRRRQKGENELQDASFFDSQNQARHRALLEALSDLDAFLSSDEGQIAIFDATNTTEERRNFLIRQFHGRWQYMFIESICNDEEVLEANYKAKMMYSPDYKGVRTEMAVEDFKARIRKYEEVATTITNRNIHYIKLIDMVTGKGHMDINRISGYIPGKIVFYLMQVCKAGLSHKRKIWLSRHGESVYNTRGLIGGDSPLSPQGQQYADVLPNVLIERLPLTDDVPMPVSVWTSTLKRTCETAEHLPFPKLRWKALDEIHAGICDGMTYEQIEQDTPDIHTARKADKLRFRYPSGESYLDVIQRLEPVIIEMERERECVCIVAHQAVLRAIYGYFMNIPQDQIPSLPMPLHTLIELTPNPEGQMVEERISIPIPNTSRPTSTADADSTPKYPNVEHFPPQLFESPRLVTPKASMDRVVSADDTSSLMDQGLIARKLSPRTLSGTTLASI